VSLLKPRITAIIKESDYSATEFTANSHDDTTSSLALRSAEVSIFKKNLE